MSKRLFIVVADDDSHIRRLALEPDEPTMTLQVSDLANANPARGHKEARRSTGHIMVTPRYSNQQGLKSRQIHCQVRLTKNIGNLPASRRCLWIRTTFSTVWSTASISEPELQAAEKDCLMCCPSTKSMLYKNTWVGETTQQGAPWSFCDTTGYSFLSSWNERS